MFWPLLLLRLRQCLLLGIGILCGIATSGASASEPLPKTLSHYPELRQMGVYASLLQGIERLYCDRPSFARDAGIDASMEERTRLVSAFQEGIERESGFKSFAPVEDASSAIPVMTFQAQDSVRVGVSFDEILSRFPGSIAQTRIRVFKFPDSSQKVPNTVFGKEVSEISMMTFYSDRCELKSVSFLPMNLEGVAESYSFYQASPTSYHERFLLNPEIQTIDQIYPVSFLDSLPIMKALREYRQFATGRKFSDDVEFERRKDALMPAKTWATMIDSGVDYNHPELATHIVRDQIGADPTDQDSLPYDYADCLICDGSASYHGTSVAGVMMKGLPASVKLYTIRVAGDGGPALEKLDQEIQKAYDLGSRVVNVSMEDSVCEDWEPFRKAVMRLPEMLFVVAAGNVGMDLENAPICPATFQYSNLITVGSVNDEGQWSASSGYSKRFVHLAARGERIPTLAPEGKTAIRSGTSFSAPAVARTIVAIQAVRPDLKAERIRQILEATVSKTDELREVTVWGGILNPRAAFDRARAEPYAE